MSDGFTPLPMSLEGAHLVEVTYTPGPDSGVIEDDAWPIAGWDAAGNPAVVTPDGSLRAKAPATQITRHSQDPYPFYVTRWVRSVADVAGETRALRQAMVNQKPGMDADAALRGGRRTETVELPQ